MPVESGAMETEGSGESGGRGDGGDGGIWAGYNNVVQVLEKVLE